MKKVTIKNKQGAIGWGAEMLDPTQWIADCVSNNYWGLPERWVPHKDEGGVYDDADVLEERVVEDEPAVEPVLISEGIPAKPAVYDNGNLISEATEEVPAVYTEGVPAKTHKEVKLKAEYTVEIEDITEKLEQEKVNAEAMAYLASTDWLIVRQMDSGVMCPEDIKLARQAARDRIK